MRRLIGSLGVAIFFASGASACPVANPEGRVRVDVQTVLGDICLEMLDGPGEAPGTVANFLGYVARGDYDQSFFHRSIPGFILQGGGFFWTAETSYGAVPAQPPILNEPGISNLRGTVAMAKFAGDPDSAINQWFINLADNAAILDGQNGGFTVFARVADEDMPVVDAIEDLHTESGQFAIDDPLAAAFTNLPVLELLERDPAGYGCLIVFPDPLNNGTPRFDATACTSQQEADDSLILTIVALDPQVPERLVMIEQAVPEPGAMLQLVLGVLVLSFGGRARRAR